MTTKPRTLDKRFQVYVDMTDGTQRYLINSYTDEVVAKKAVSVLNAEVPGSFVANSWYVDTRTDAEILATNA